MHSPLEGVLARLNAQLLRRLGPERYGTWNHNARPCSFDEEEFVFHFENTYVKDKIERLFKDAVTGVARDVTNRNVRVRFAVETASFARPSAAALADVTLADGATFATFVEGRGNRMALRAARAFCSPRGGPRSLLLYAASGLGKTHLIRAIGEELSRGGLPALSFRGDQFTRYFTYAQRQDHVEAFLKKCRTAPVFLLDDLHLLSGKDEAQLALLDILTALAERGGRAALTSESHPRAMEGLRPRVRNRLRPEREATIDPPDPATGAALLRARAPSAVPCASLAVIAETVQSSHKDQLHCLDRLLEQHPPGPAAARAVVAEFLSRWSRRLTYEDIARAAAESFGVTVSEIYANGRSGPAAEARQACYYLARKLLREPFAAIGGHFGGRDHATVLQACTKISRRRGGLRERLRRLEEGLGNGA